MTDTLHVGYEVGTGAPVAVPLHHLVATGLTRLSGKSTAIEGLLSRAPKHFASLVFRTKRAEISFKAARPVVPFYRQQTNWEYVESLLEAAMKERMKMERSFIIKACHGAESLRDVYSNIRELRASARRGFDESVWTTLEAYFEKILPQLEQQVFATTLELRPGPHVMDLGHLSEEVQALVIAACLEELWKSGRETIVVIPECWKFLPQARGNPVKWAAQHLIREGGASGLYLWMDSQDVTGVEKAILKSVDVWLLGRQRELNEVQRVLAQIPVVGKPKAQEIMTLPVGHFYVAAQDWCRKVYTQPAWLQHDAAKAVAMGRTAIPTVPVDNEQEEIDMERLEDLEGKVRTISEAVETLRQQPLHVRLGDFADAVVVKVLERLPANGVPQIVLAPLPMLHHRYQQETVERLLTMVRNLSEQERRTLEWLVAVDKTVRLKELAMGLGVPISGGSYTALGSRVESLIRLGLVMKDSHGVQGTVLEKVRGELAPYSAPEEEVNATTQALIGALAGKDEV